MHLYLKYFHERKTDLSKSLEEFERENNLQTEGTVSSSHIDKLHIDEKEDGGVDTLVDFGFIDIKKHSYRSAKRKKNKNKFSELTLKIYQTSYSKSGNAWKVWDSGIVMARWAYENRNLFKDKQVHEIGAGCALTGILLSKFCKRVIISDYKPEILENIQFSISSNEGTFENIELCCVDFEKLAKRNDCFEEKSEIVVGSDIIYGLHLSEWLPLALEKLLTDDGTFYCINPKNRIGVDEFISSMECRGFECSLTTCPEVFCDDFAKKSFWDLIRCKKKHVS